jgi:hypothetical protein
MLLLIVQWQRMLVLWLLNLLQLAAATSRRLAASKKGNHLPLAVHPNLATCCSE